jgi:Na+/melibiose symporter-like transporter
MITERNVQVGIYAMALAAGGIPLYIHLPRFVGVELGWSLTAVAALLLGMRLLDFIQDPALGWIADQWQDAQPKMAAFATLTLAAGFFGLFSLVDPDTPAWVLIAILAAIFTSYSLAMILFYGRTRALATGGATSDLVRIARVRETGTIAGIVLVAALPSFVGYPGFGLALLIILLLAAVVSRPIWALSPDPATRLSWSDLVNSGGGWLLALTLLNSLPVAITSTLFVFFVEDGLGLSGQSGLYLILFFVSAAAALPVWTGLNRKSGPRLALLIAMSLAILSFGWAGTLAPGSSVAFAVICIASGAALGAEMMLLPALFSGVLDRAGLQTGQAFGLWSFANKMALAAAAAIVLPLLDASGFQAGEINATAATDRLRALYAYLPIALKLLSISLVFLLPKKVLAA